MASKTISGVAFMALQWFACVTGTFGDEFDRAPEPAVVYELRAAGLLRPWGQSYEPTAKGDALLAEMAAADKIAHPFPAAQWMKDEAVAFVVQDIPTTHHTDRRGKPFTLRGYSRVWICFRYGLGTSQTTWSIGVNCKDIEFRTAAQARAHVRATFGAIPEVSKTSEAKV